MLAESNRLFFSFSLTFTISFRRDEKCINVTSNWTKKSHDRRAIVTTDDS